MFSVLPNVGSSLPSGSQFASKLARPAMRFTDKWGVGDIFDWYQSQKQTSVTSVTIKSLQIRVDQGTPPHRFVLICTQDDEWHRFDRRPETGNPATLLRETAIATHRIAADDFCPVSKEELADIEKATYCEIDVTMPPSTDLLWILSICFAMSQDNHARYYDLFRYNCYFFSWTILLVVTRRALPYAVPSPENVIQNLRPDLDSLSRSLTKKTVQALLSIVLNVITSVRDETGNSIKAGMSPAGRLVWKLPLGFMRFVLQQALRIQLYLGLEENMHKKMYEWVIELCQSLLEDAWDKRDLTDHQVGQRLWIRELIGDIKPALEAQLVRIIWDAILDIIASVHGKVDCQQEINRIEHTLGRRSRLKSRLFGDIQWVQVWNEALSTALPVARDAAHGKAQVMQTILSGQPGSTSYSQLHAEVFDIAFQAACDSALNAARRVANETQAQHKNPKRADMWEKVWKLWDRIWASAHTKAKEIVVPIVEEGVEEVVNLVSEHVVRTVGNVEARKAHISVHHRKNEQAISSISELQTHIHHSIDSAFRAVPQNVPSIHEAMLRVWDKCRTLDEPQQVQDST
ncbi:hypothetical protein OPQ81_002165 [Rhizoctonia solani]|nr:hypothetical protein OPQ81_002165 [Rhizoctonia solani]